MIIKAENSKIVAEMCFKKHVFYGLVSCKHCVGCVSGIFQPLGSPCVAPSQQHVRTGVCENM